jgi:glycosyltransferase involved in cell wall biosynthesis
MAAGVPALVSDVGGLAEMAGDEAALPPTDVDAWAAAIERLWSEPELRRERGESALARARERFGADGYYERLTACYRAAAGEGR